MFISMEESLLFMNPDLSSALRQIPSNPLIYEISLFTFLAAAAR